MSLNLSFQKCWYKCNHATAAAKSLQSCLTLCDPWDGSPPGSLIPGILQARTLEWVAFSFSNARKWKVKVKSLSHIRPSATPWTAAFQAPPSMRFSRQEYWSRVPLPSPEHVCSTIQILFIITYFFLVNLPISERERDVFLKNRVSIFISSLKMRHF